MTRSCPVSAARSGSICSSCFAGAVQSASCSRCNKRSCSACLTPSPYTLCTPPHEQLVCAARSCFLRAVRAAPRSAAGYGGGYEGVPSNFSNLALVMNRRMGAERGGRLFLTVFSVCRSASVAFAAMRTKLRCELNFTVFCCFIPGLK